MRNLLWCHHCSRLSFPWLFWALHTRKRKKECGRACGEDECDREDLARRSTVDFEGQGVAVMERHHGQIGFLLHDTATNHVHSSRNFHSTPPSVSQISEVADTGI